MFASSVVDKENIQGDVLVSTPARKPLQMLQTISQNAVSEGTPTVLRKKTPKQRLSNIINTPASSRRQSRRYSKRQSVPLPLSKLAVSIFEDEMLTRSAMVDIPAAMTGKILENCKETESRELNEMLRKKVFETVTKMRERYEVCLAEKEKDLKEQNCIIEQLKTKVNILKQNQKDINKALVPTITTEETQNTHEDEEVSLLVQHVLSKAVKDMEVNNFSSGRQTNISVNDPITPVTEVDSMTSVNTLRCVSQEKPEIPVHIQQTNYSPTKHNNVSTSMTPTDHSKHTNVSTSMTPTDHVKHTNISTSMTPTDHSKHTNVSTSMTPTDHAKHTNISTSMTPTDDAKHTNVSTSMTPTDHVNQDTMVSPIITCNTSVVTSPLVAVLQPEMTNQLPVETLRSELVSAAISNELLRSECDNLNRKVEDLESCLTEVRNLASKECGDYQERVDQLQKELDVAQEINYQMETKKPHSVEEYEDVIQRLQKDVLLKEKQIVFYAKKASEADNLQKDLRRMYDKYNAEHKLYLAQEQKIKGLINEHDAKCSELETMRAEFTGIRMEFSEAKATIDEQEKERIVANKNEVKCCALEEQIEVARHQELSVGF